MIKIIHIGDEQYEIRTGGTMAQRHSEFKYVDTKVIQYIQEEKPQLLYIAGDVFQFQMANAEETKMFSLFLHAVLPYVEGIRIINGNHDIAQKSNAILEESEKRNLTDHIDSVVTAVNSDKIRYYKYTGFYKDPLFDIMYAVWSQLDKHSAEDTPRPFNPWELPGTPSLTKAHIELYHDPIAGSLGFDGKPERHFLEHKTTFSDFKYNTVLAGDIHAPRIVQEGCFTFTYCSSLVQRNYGEGAYYAEETLLTDGNSMHGLNRIIFDVNNDVVNKIDFVPIKPSVGRHTIRLSKDFNYDLISALKIEEYAYNYIRIIISGNIDKFILNEDKLIKHFLDSYKCSVDIDFDKNALADVDVEEFTDIDALINEETIKRLGEKYIDAAVDKTSTVASELKDRAKELFKQLLNAELNGINLSTERKNITLGSATLSNFMTFGGDVSFDFPNIPITRISGSNGVGKTSMFFFVAWMLTNKISSLQNDRDKRTNYALLFNDRLEEDTVTGELTFAVNKMQVKLTKKLTRKWKKHHESKRFDKDWIDYLAGTPKLSMAIECSDLTSDDTTEVLAYLKENVLTHSEFTKLMFVDQSTLDNLIHSKAEDLNQSILKNIGLNFFDGMLAEYDGLKEKHLGKLDKPASTVEAKMVQIAEIEEASETIGVDIENAKLLAQQKNEEIEAKQLLKESILSKLHNVAEFDDIEQAIHKLETSKAEFAENKTESERLLKEHADKLAEKDVPKLQNELAGLEAEKTSLETKQATKKTERDTTGLALVEKTNSITTIAQLVKTELEGDLQQLKTDLSDNENKVAVVSTKELELRNKVNNKFSSMIEELNEKHSAKRDEIGKSALHVANNKSDMFLLTTEAENIDKVIIGYGAEQVDLKESAICTECKREHTHETRAGIENKISALEGLIEEESAKKTEKISEVLRLKALHEELEAQVEVQKSEAQKLLDKKEQVTALKSTSILDLPSPTFDSVKESALEMQKERQGIVSKSFEIQELIDAAKIDLLDKIKKDSRILAASTESDEIKQRMSDIDDAIIEYGRKIEGNRLELLGKTTEVGDCERLQYVIDKQKAYLSDLNDSNQSYVTDMQALLDDKKKALENKEWKQQSDEAAGIIRTLTESMELLRRNVQVLVVKESNMATDIERYKADILSIKKYNLVESVLKLYKRMLSKTGLPQYVFEHVIPILNSKLNDLLASVQFRLYFDKDDLHLKMVDLTKNVTRPVMFSSGMETTLLGLALVAVLRQLNAGKRTTELFIDEISGKLNDGTKLSYVAPNYKKIFANIIKEIKANSSIYIIDHVVEEIREDSVLEVQKTASGSTVTRL